jgi:serine protease Do
MKTSKLLGALALLLTIGLVGTVTAGDLEITKELQERVLDENRGYLGVQLTTVTVHNEGKNDTNVYVHGVLPGGPAEAAGLVDDDRIVTINGIPVDDLESLYEAMGSTQPDQTISVTLDRDGVEQTVSVRLAALPVGQDSRWGVVVDENRPYFGVHIEELNSQLAEYFEVDGGILVTQVIEGTPADEAGVQAGDIVVAVEGQAVGDRHTLQLAIADIEPGDEVAVRIERRGSPLTLYVKAGSHAEHNMTIDLRKLHDLHKMVIVGDAPHSLVIHREKDRAPRELAENEDD